MSKETAKRDIIRIEAGVRYAEDAEVNGIAEDEENPRMPFLERDSQDGDGWRWNIDIDIATGEVIGWRENFGDIRAQTFYKVCDCCRVKYDGMEQEDYVPDFLAIDGEGFGDYIYLTIGCDGTIKGWKPDRCRKFIAEWRNNQ